MDRFAAYHRISQLNGRDAEDNLSSDDAFARIDGWAATRPGIELAEHRYLDSDVSGSKLDRPALDRMLADLRSGEIDGIVVAQVDRLSRADVGDALRLVAEIDDIAPGKLAILDLGIDPTTETGELMLTMLLALARMQWRRYRRQWSTARSGAVERGVFIGPAPLGYRFTQALDRNGAPAFDKKTGEPVHGPLEPDPATAPIVRTAFEIAAHDGLHAACRYLAGELPAMRWRTSDARRILSSRVYLGIVEHGALMNASAHPALVSLDVWTAAQTDPRHRRASGDYLLSGIATCGQCGSGLTGQLQTVKGQNYRRLRCSNAACTAGSSISADRLDAHVREIVTGALCSASFRLRFDDGDLAAARDAVDRAESERKSFALDLDLARALGADAFKAGAQVRKVAVDEARAAYRIAAAQSAQAETLPAADAIGDDAAFSVALGAMVDRVVVARGRGSIDERVSIEWLGENVDDGVTLAA